MTIKPITILVVDDNPTDIMIMREAFASTKVQVDLQTACDGVAALQFLRRMGPNIDAPRPDLILLDLNMPGKNGHEVLAEIKADESLRSIPVVILTTSQSEDDLARAYASHVNCYIRKPVDFEKFMKVVASIEEFWFAVVSLPSVDQFSVSANPLVYGRVSD
jgi:CheY-like chemotaxis protein